LQDYRDLYSPDGKSAQFGSYLQQHWNWSAGHDLDYGERDRRLGIGKLAGM